MKMHVDGRVAGPGHTPVVHDERRLRLIISQCQRFAGQESPGLLVLRRVEKQILGILRDEIVGVDKACRTER